MLEIKTNKTNLRERNKMGNYHKDEIETKAWRLIEKKKCNMSKKARSVLESPLTCILLGN
jgi:hypothetical protein